MKKFSTFVNEAKKSLLEIQDDTIDYISVADLKKYLQVADKFLSDETKEVVQYLIVNNANYIKDLGGKGTSENALADFYNNGPYKEPDKKERYALIGKINKFYDINCLNQQEFVKDSNYKVEKYLAEKGIKLVDFVRFEKGEGLEKKEENFADEVASMMK